MLAGGWTAEAKKALLDRAVAMLDEAAPGVERPAGRERVLTPVDSQDELGISEGSITTSSAHSINGPPARYAHLSMGSLSVRAAVTRGPGVTLAPGVCLLPERR